MKNTNKKITRSLEEAEALRQKWYKEFGPVPEQKKPGSIMRKGRRMVLQDSFGGTGSGFGHSRGSK